MEKETQETPQGGEQEASQPEPQSPFDRAVAAIGNMFGDEPSEATGDDESSEKVAAEPAPEEASESKEEASTEQTSQAKERESRRWAELERRDAQARREHREQMAQLEEQRKQLEQQQAQWQSQLDALQQLKEDPVEAMKKLGYSWQEVVSNVVKKGQKPDLSPVNDEIKKLREEMEAKLKEEREERERLEYERQVLEIHNEIQETIGKDPEDEPHRWAMLRQEPQWDQEVWDLVSAEYQQTGKQLTYQEAADKIEKYLRDEWKRRHDTITKVMGGGSNEATGETEQAPARQDKGSGNSSESEQSSAANPKTLSNAAASEVRGRKDSPRTKEEYLQNAMALVEKSGGLFNN